MSEQKRDETWSTDPPTEEGWIWVYCTDTKQMLTVEIEVEAGCWYGWTHDFNFNGLDSMRDDRFLWGPRLTPPPVPRDSDAQENEDA